MSPQVCTYVRRQGQNAGVPCGNLVTALDPNHRYCSHHYRRILVPAATASAATASVAASAAVTAAPASPGDVRAILTELHSQLTELVARVDAALQRV